MTTEANHSILDSLRGQEGRERGAMLKLLTKSVGFPLEKQLPAPIHPNKFKNNKTSELVTFYDETVIDDRHRKKGAYFLIQVEQTSYDNETNSLLSPHPLLRQFHVHNGYYVMIEESTNIQPKHVVKRAEENDLNELLNVLENIKFATDGK